MESLHCSCIDVYDSSSLLQKTLPPVGFPEIKSCKILQSFKDNDLSSLVQIDGEEGLHCVFS